MSHEPSKSAVPPVQQGRRRSWTLEAAREVTAYRASHSWKETTERYGLGKTQIDRLKAMVAGEKVGRSNGHGGTGRHTYLLARKLKDAVTERLRLTGEPGDVEIYATLLTRQLLE